MNQWRDAVSAGASCSGVGCKLADSRGAEDLPGRTWQMKLDAGELGVVKRAQCGGQTLVDSERSWGLLRSLDGRLKTVGGSPTKFKVVTVPPGPPASRFLSLLATTIAQGYHCIHTVLSCWFFFFFSSCFHLNMHHRVGFE